MAHTAGNNLLIGCWISFLFYLFQYFVPFYFYVDYIFNPETTFSFYFYMFRQELSNYVSPLEQISMEIVKSTIDDVQLARKSFKVFSGERSKNKVLTDTPCEMKTSLSNLSLNKEMTSHTETSDQNFEEISTQNTAYNPDHNIVIRIVREPESDGTLGKKKVKCTYEPSKHSQPSLPDVVSSSKKTLCKRRRSSTKFTGKSSSHSMRRKSLDKYNVNETYQYNSFPENKANLLNVHKFNKQLLRSKQSDCTFIPTLISRSSVCKQSQAERKTKHCNQPPVDLFKDCIYKEDFLEHILSCIGFGRQQLVVLIILIIGESC